MTVSIIVCTYNRGNFLKRLLDSLKYLNYKNFEVIVVNGPSTDNTEEILDRYINGIKVEKCPVTNLSVSRNIGIKAASGDIVAFIDDDAIPDKMWLDDILSLYRDETIGGVGGVVRDGSDFSLIQQQNVVIDIWGVPVGSFDKPQNYNDPNGELFNIMIGCNCSFRRNVLIEVGGFDEYYEYFHDESDLAVRVIKKGYKVLHHPRAYVYHAYASSDLRSETRIIKNWYPIVKNSTYFSMKNTESLGLSINERRKIAKEKLLVFKNNTMAGIEVTSQEYYERYKMYKKAYNHGLKDGLETERRLNYDLKTEQDFLKYDIDKMPEAMSICMLCRYDPLSQLGGIAKYTMELSNTYIKLGHNVHIITEGESGSYLRCGINYHFVKQVKIDGVDEQLSLSPICKNNLQYSYSAYRKLLEVHNIYNIDIVESALWDYEGIVSSKLTNIPLVVRVETPSLMVAQTQKLQLNSDLQLNAEFEAAFINNADGIIYISKAIKNTIEKMYNINFDSRRSELIYLGLDNEIKKQIKKDNENKLTILFVGRLERRKGIHNIIDVIPKIMQKYPNVEFRFVGQDDLIDNVIGSSFKEYFYNKNKNEKWINKVKFLGMIENEEKEQEFANCDIFISPSLYESFGIIFIEAMRYEKPVIGCNVGGMKEVITNGETGILIELDNTEMLTNALISLIDNKQLRLEMGKKGKEKFVNMFTNNIASSASINFYKKVIRMGKRYEHINT